MGLVTAAQSIDGFSDGLLFAQETIQSYVRIRRRAAGTAAPFSLAQFGGTSDQEIFLNITEDESLTYKVTIAEKPVGNIGGVKDYINRESAPLQLTSVISNRSLNVLNDPQQALQDIANSLAPEVAAGLEQTRSFASNFVDLGGDEMDLKIKSLRKWQLDGDIVEVLGVKLDAFNHIQKNQTFNYLIEEIALSYNQSFGDNIGLTLTLKNLLIRIEDGNRAKRGGKLGESVNGSIPAGANPF
jgi:hypothetical protein